MSSSSPTWAQVASRPLPMEPNPAKPSPPPAPPFRSRRLIISLSDPTFKLNSYSLRNTLNSSLGLHPPPIASVTWSTMQRNLVITTTPTYSAKTLAAHMDKISPHLPLLAAKEDVQWHKVVVHGVPVPPFLNHGLARLKEEVETFNPGMSLMTTPNWLTSADTLTTKQHSSIVLSFPTEAMAQQAIRKRLFIAGVSLSVEKLFSASKDTQCSKCFRFGHVTADCPQTPRCKFCTGSHPTEAHQCATCPAKGRICSHLKPSCVNCGKSHIATSPGCEVFMAVRARKQRPPPPTGSSWNTHSGPPLEEEEF